MLTQRRRLATLLVLSAAFLLTSCSSSDKSATPSASPAAQAGAGVAQAIADAAETSSGGSAEPSPSAEVTTPAGVATQAGETGYESPEAVRDAYIAAYQGDNFAPVLRFACPEYLQKYGTDTSVLEDKLSSYTVTGEPVGDAVVLSDAKSELQIRLTLTSADNKVSVAPLKIIVVKLDDGRWRYCGEGRVG